MLLYLSDLKVSFCFVKISNKLFTTNQFCDYNFEILYTKL